MKRKTEKNNFYKLKKLEKEKIIFREIRSKWKSAPKWTSNKMGNTKKGHNKTGSAKVVVPKRRASGSASLSLKPSSLPIVVTQSDEILQQNRPCVRVV